MGLSVKKDCCRYVMFHIGRAIKNNYISSSLLHTTWYSHSPPPPNPHASQKSGRTISFPCCLTVWGMRALKPLQRNIHQRKVNTVRRRDRAIVYGRNAIFLNQMFWDGGWGGFGGRDDGCTTWDNLLMGLICIQNHHILINGYISNHLEGQLQRKPD